MLDEKVIAQVRDCLQIMAAYGFGNFQVELQILGWILEDEAEVKYVNG